MSTVSQLQIKIIELQDKKIEELSNQISYLVSHIHLLQDHTTQLVVACKTGYVSGGFKQNNGALFLRDLEKSVRHMAGGDTPFGEGLRAKAYAEEDAISCLPDFLMRKISVETLNSNTMRLDEKIVALKAELGKTTDDIPELIGINLFSIDSNSARVYTAVMPDDIPMNTNSTITQKMYVNWGGKPAQVLLDGCNRVAYASMVLNPSAEIIRVIESLIDMRDYLCKN